MNEKEQMLKDELRFNTQTALDGNSAIDSEKKRIKVVLSDETPVVRWGWEEGIYDIVLSHDTESVDLSRTEIMPLLVQHDRDMLPIGKWENIRIENKKLKGEAVFDSEDKFAMEIFGKFERGFMKSFSIGIGSWEKVLEKDRNENNRPQYKAIKWSLEECSVVTIPANKNAKVGMSKETLGVNPASADAQAKIKSSNKGEDMAKDHVEELQALEATHAEAVQKLNATHTEALQTLEKEHETKMNEAIASRVNLSKEIFSMAFERGLDKETALSMLDKPSLESAKAFMVDSMKTDFAPVVSEKTENKENEIKQFNTRCNNLGITFI